MTIPCSSEHDRGLACLAMFMHYSGKSLRIVHMHVFSLKSIGEVETQCVSDMVHVIQLQLRQSKQG